MAQFWKPGSARPEVPLSLQVDADGSGADVIDSALLMSARSFGSLGLEEQRRRLPVAKQRRAILFLVETHAVTVVVGHTGCGKTTQIPQYLVEAGWAAGGRMVACTQPRRVAAQTVAARVAEEMGVTLGAQVGYSIRFDNVTTKGVTQIKLLTDGVLLREMMEDPLLSQYSVIMIDEAHERSVGTDLLLGLLKKVLKRRLDLRLIIASATMAAEEMADFFDSTKAEKRSKNQSGQGGGEAAGKNPDLKPAIISVEGRMHPVRLLYLQKPCSDFIQSAFSTVVDIHEREMAGDILVFLTGQEEVDTLVSLIQDEAQTSKRTASSNCGYLWPLPLYSGLSSEDQDLVLSPTPRGRRKVILATNIAETSVTIEGVVYVVDCGFVKQRFYNPVTDIESLLLVPISRASAVQRAGRAGRVRPGKCFRLYTEDSFLTKLKPNATPEIQRSNLAPILLQLKAMGIDNVMRFDWLSPPSPEAMIRALELLFALDAIDNDAKLTIPTGLQMAEMPLEPLLCKALISSASRFKSSSELITVAACMCVQSVWVGSRGRQQEADEMRDRFAASEGDHVTFLNVFEAFRRSGASGRWCHENGLNYKAMLRVVDIRKQLENLLQRLGLPIVSCGQEILNFRKAVVCGFFPNAALYEPHVDGEGTYRSLKSNLLLKIHPSSVLFRATPSCVVYSNAVASNSSTYMKDVSAIELSWLPEIAPHFYKTQERR